MSNFLPAYGSGNQPMPAKQFQPATAQQLRQKQQQTADPIEQYALGLRFGDQPEDPNATAAMAAQLQNRFAARKGELAGIEQGALRSAAMPQADQVEPQPRRRMPNTYQRPYPTTKSFLPDYNFANVV